MRHWSGSVSLTAVLAGLALGAHPSVPAQGVASGQVAAWSVRLSGTLVQAAQDGAMSLVPDADDGLWLTTENTVTRYHDGLWEQPQQPPSAAGLFALAPTGTDAWAFGYEGGVWRRVAGTWSAVASPTTADLYAAAARGGDEVWAAGFDYAAEQGMLLRVAGGSLQAITRPWLGRIQLYSLAAAPSGELWAGGCSYSDAPFLMRDGGHGDWQPVTVPVAIGCVFHLSFAPTGFGLAAAGTDLLRWDGATWEATQQAPPAGLQWLRVAALADTRLATGGTPVTGQGWAIPAVPTWRGYVRGDTPWYFDGDSWQPGTVDYGPYAAAFEDSTAANVRPFVALATAGGSAWVVSLGSAGGSADQSVTALLKLDAYTGSVHAPFFLATSDVAALPEGPLWVAGSGAAPLLGSRAGAGWAAGVTAPTSAGPSFAFVDLAGPTAGWALARAADGSFGQYVPWRWDGSRWQETPPPAGWEIRRVRALPDGGAWASTADGLLVAWRDGSWAQIPGAPAVPVPPTSDILPLARPQTPFDVAADGPRLVGCVATPSGLYRYADGTFTPVSMPARSPRYVDVQLTGAHSGWALPVDRTGLELMAGQVARLTDCQPQLLRVDATGGMAIAGPFQVMSAVDADTVFLYRGVIPGRSWPQLLGYRVGTGPFFEHTENCAAVGMAAVPTADGADVWLAGGPWPASGASACGPATTESPPPWQGLLGRLTVRAIHDQLWLPALRRW
jgi:hypothetical protein